MKGLKMAGFWNPNFMPRDHSSEAWSPTSQIILHATDPKQVKHPFNLAATELQAQAGVRLVRDIQVGSGKDAFSEEACATAFRTLSRFYDKVITNSTDTGELLSSGFAVSPEAFEEGELPALDAILGRRPSTPALMGNLLLDTMYSYQAMDSRTQDNFNEWLPLASEAVDFLDLGIQVVVDA